MTVVFMRWQGQDSACIYVSSKEHPENAAYECFRMSIDSRASFADFRSQYENGEFSYVTLPVRPGSIAQVGHLL